MKTSGLPTHEPKLNLPENVIW